MHFFIGSQLAANFSLWGLIGGGNTYSTMIFSRRCDLPVSIPLFPIVGGTLPYAKSLILELSFPSSNRMMEVMHFP
jgi:hypothetical protein